MRKKYGCYNWGNTEKWVNKNVKYKSVTDVRKNWKKNVKKIKRTWRKIKRSLSKENEKTLY